MSARDASRDAPLFRPSCFMFQTSMLPPSSFRSITNALCPSLLACPAGRRGGRDRPLRRRTSTSGQLSHRQGRRSWKTGSKHGRRGGRTAGRSARQHEGCREGIVRCDVGWCGMAWTEHVVAAFCSMPWRNAVATHCSPSRSRRLSTLYGCVVHRLRAAACSKNTPLPLHL